MAPLRPKVTITIPTYNSARSISVCLDAIRRQYYKHIDVSIVDSHSTDNTVSIAKRAGVKNIYTYKGGLLGSRLEGIKHAKGDYILLLDSDQILTKQSVEKCVRLCEKGRVDMVALEEDVYEVSNWLQWLFKMDRKVINTAKNLDPETGVILPRFFRKRVLSAVIRAIPKDIVHSVGGPDHAILYFEARKLSHGVGVVKNAVLHMETASFPRFIQKCYRWGYTSYSAKTVSKYATLMERKERFRTGLFTKGLVVASIASIALLVLKGIPYKLGYLMARMKGDMT